MRSFSLCRFAFSGGAAVALLAGCGGGGETATPSAGQAVQPVTQSRTFNFTGTKQSFVVPAGVTRVTVVARGAGGDSCPRTGRGARAYAVIPVAPRERLAIYVGGQGKGSRSGGFNGGGESYSGYGGGGGASDVRVSPGGLRDRILVAAGGGAKGGTYQDCIYGVPYGEGGGGGGLTGESGQVGWYYGYGSGRGGSGGTQTQGGAGGGTGSGCKKPGSPGANGALGRGGNGGKEGFKSGYGYYGDSGAGGGGGYFGGGGGGGSCYTGYGDGSGGGGGGSSYAEPGATNVRYWPNWKNASGNGLIVISW